VAGMNLDGGGALARERGRGEWGWVWWRMAGALPIYRDRREGAKRRPVGLEATAVMASHKSGHY
jgi:hypothetical protein